MPFQKINLFFILILLIISGCNSPEKKPLALPTGDFVFSILFQDETEKTFKLPIEVNISSLAGKPLLEIRNGKEIIKVKEIEWRNDSLFFNMPVFLTEFALGYSEENFQGTFIKNDREIPVKYEVIGVKGYQRFNANSTQLNIQGNWKTKFSYPEGESYPAIGEFFQDGNQITGTFLTETGDYRYLKGVLDEDSLKLSAFDGSHAFLFLAQIKDDSIQGIFKASDTHIEYWKAEKNETFKLANADSLTYLKPGSKGISFSLPNLEGETITFPSEKFEGKVVVVQLMGSWCPNCMDETVFLTELYNKFNPKGLEIISLAFERFKNFDKAAAAVNRVKTHFGSQYHFLIAGTSSKESAAKVLPMINAVMSYPTAIFINKKGHVVKIHTGFSGPGTSEYAPYVVETTAIIEKLLSE